MHYGMSKKYFTLLFFIAVIPLVGYGQNTPQSLGTLTLEQCIKIAQKNSPVSKSNKFQLLASKWQYQQIHADLLPSLTLSGDAPNYNKDIFQVVQPNGQTTFRSRQQSNANASLGIEENILPTGGSISLSSGLTRLGIFGGENTYLWKSTPLQLGIRQPIFQFNSLKWQHRV
jgi:outer membrane protein TolC